MLVQYEWAGGTEAWVARTVDLFRYCVGPVFFELNEMLQKSARADQAHEQRKKPQKLPK